MNKFQKKPTLVEVSKIDKNDWWLGNGQEHVAKGTALGADFITNIYNPTSPGMTAKYDHDNDEWLEVYDSSQLEFWDITGQHFKIGTPDGTYPEWAIKTKPPAFNPITQTVLYNQDDQEWTVYDILINTKYYDHLTNELTVSDFNFVLPENHTFTAPPKAKKGYAVRLVSNKWKQLIDHRDKLAYSKDRNHEDDYTVEELGEIKDTHTLLEHDTFDSWDKATNQWKYDQERERPVKIANEKAWRNSTLTEVINRMDQYNQDQNLPDEFKRSPFNQEQFLQLASDRALLSDYTETDGFPFCERPKLSGLIDE